MEDPLILPFTIIVDTREQFPYHFTGFRADTRQRYRPLVIPVKRAALKSGDYSIDGFEDRVAVERKSLSDLYGSIGGERDRFQREFERLAEYEYAAVVIEAGWPAILHHPPPRNPSKNGRLLLPKHVYRTAIAWQQRFPRVHWWPCDTRNFAERTTFRILEMFWRRQQKLPQDETGVTDGEGFEAEVG